MIHFLLSFDFHVIVTTLTVLASGSAAISYGLDIHEKPAIKRWRERRHRERYAKMLAKTRVLEALYPDLRSTRQNLDQSASSPEDEASSSRKASSPRER